MKKGILVLIVLMSVYSTAHCQIFSFGVKAGANINKLDGEAFSDQFSYGYHAGAFATIGLGKHWALQPEVLFSQVNVDTSNNVSTVYNPSFNNISQIQLSYLSIPVLLEYKLSKGISLQAGPQYSILLNQNTSLVQNGKNVFTQGDFSVLGGVELKIQSFRIYGRYAIGLSNINNITNEDQWKSQSIQVGVGLTLF